MPTESSRVALRYLTKTAVYDPISEARGIIKKALDSIPAKMDQVMAKMNRVLKKHGLQIDTERSSIDWNARGSDGLRVYFELVLKETGEPMDSRQVSDVLEKELDVVGNVYRKDDHYVVSTGW